MIYDLNDYAEFGILLLLKLINKINPKKKEMQII